MAADDDRIPGLTLEERAFELGVSYLEQMELEQTEPWVKHWSGRWRHGAVNMRAWLAAGRPAADLTQLCIFGAPSTIRAISGIVERLPAAVAWHTVQHVRIACTHPGLGVTGPAPLPPPGGEQTAIVMPWTDPDFVAHEISHAWQRDPFFFAGLTAVQIERLDEVIATHADAAGDENTDQGEVAADAMASQLLGHRVDTSGGARPRGRRLSVRDAERAIKGTPE